jgi:hypothetical protein
VRNGAEIHEERIMEAKINEIAGQPNTKGVAAAML